MDLNSEWLEFQNTIDSNNYKQVSTNNSVTEIKQENIPKCSDIYILSLIHI